MAPCTRLVALAMALTAAVAVPAQAQWVQNGRQMGADFYYSDIPSNAPDGQGGAFVLWSQSLTETRGIHLQHVDRNGVSTWGSDILLHTNASLSSSIAPDGSGGAIVAWRHYVTGSGDIRAQRFDVLGNALWAAGGVHICDAPNEQRDPILLADGTGGATVAWLDDRAGVNASDVYTQRLDAAGGVLWTTNGRAVCTATGAQSQVTLVPVGAGSVVFVWTDSRAGPSDIYTQRLDASGNPSWAADGVAVCNQVHTQASARAAPDGAGGVIVAWTDYRTQGGPDVFAQRILSSGAPLWATNGVPVSSQTNAQQSPWVVADGDGGVFVAWSDQRTGVRDIYAQRITGNGFPLWTGDGVAVCTAAGNQEQPRMIADGAGGILIGWNDLRVSFSDLYGQRMDGDGNTLWTPNGVAICTRPGEQYYPDMSLDGRGGVIASWGDYDQGAFVNRLEITHGQWGHPEPAIVSISDVPSDDGGFVDVEWSASDRDVPAFGTITEYSIWRAVGSVPTSNAATSTWQEVATAPATMAASYALSVPTTADSSAVDPAVHYYAVVARTSNAQVFFVSAPDSGYSVDNQAPTHVNKTPSLTMLTLLPNTPNPFSGMTTLRVGLPAPSDMTIEIYDVAGRRVRALEVPWAAAGWQQIPFSGLDEHGNALASGVYFYRVTANGTTVANKMVITR